MCPLHLRTFHTWLLRLVTGAAMVKLHLPPGLTEKLDMFPEDMGHIWQGSRWLQYWLCIGFSLLNFSGACAKAPSEPVARQGEVWQMEPQWSGSDPSWRASRCQTPVTHSCRSQVLVSHEGIGQSLRPYPLPFDLSTSIDVCMEASEYPG